MTAAYEVVGLSCDAGSAQIAVRVDAAAETEARRRALLAEAAAWRESAIWEAGDFLIRLEPEYIRFWDQLPSRTYIAMRERAELHTEHPSPFRCLAHEEISLFSLFMALECEDEAEALSRSGAPRKNRKRGGR